MDGERFREYVATDLARLDKVGFRGFMRQYFVSRGECFPYMFWLRAVHFARKRRITKHTIGVLAYFIMRHFEFKYGIHVDPNIHVGKGLRVVHGGNVQVGCAYVGDNVTIYQGATLGLHNGGVPTVMDNVTVYPNAVVVGGITLGEGCSVGALSYVSRDVESGSVVAGAPAKVISRAPEKG